METIISLAISWQFLLTAAACGAFGFIIKAIPGIPNWLIPMLNAAFAVVFMMLLLGFAPENALLGFLAAALATYIYELIMQGIKAATGGTYNSRQVFTDIDKGGE
jgi:ascorbate-specific PTS system EIIC-type component UlaA